MAILVSEKFKNKLKNINLQPHVWVLDSIREAALQREPNYTICLECKICHKYEVIDVKSLNPFFYGHLPLLNNLNKNECVGISKEELFNMSEYKHIYFEEISNNINKKIKNELCDKISEQYSFVVDDFIPFYISDRKASEFYNVSWHSSPKTSHDLYSWRSRLTGIPDYSNGFITTSKMEIKPRKVYKEEIELLYGKVEYMHFGLYGELKIYTKNKIILLKHGEESYEYFDEINKNPLG